MLATTPAGQARLHYNLITVCTAGLRAQTAYTTFRHVEANLFRADRARWSLNMYRTDSDIEPDCTFTHEGRAFTAGGAVVTPERITAYLGQNGQLTDWHGNVLGTYRITATWRTPRSFVSATMHQVYATVNGVQYTGRSAGVGMVFAGRAIVRKAVRTLQAAY